MLTVVAYDVADDRRREKISSLLEDYGRRVNFSVFECELKQDEFERLYEDLRSLVHKRQDRIVFYRLCAGCRERRSSLGTRLEPEANMTVRFV